DNFIAKNNIKGTSADTDHHGSEIKKKTKLKQTNLQIAALTTPQHRIQDSAGYERPDFHISSSSESSIQRMLYELQTNMQMELAKLAKDIRTDIQAIGEQTAQLEYNTEKIIWAPNTLAAASEHIEAKLEALTTKVADHTRCNNICLRGILEDVKPSELQNYALAFFKDLVPKPI
ncbi:Hypothetical predicted protein, partial [Pelobates cultripes]